MKILNYSSRRNSFLIKQLSALVLIISVAALLGACQKTEQTETEEKALIYSAQNETVNGIEAVVLRRGGEAPIKAVVTPKYGANLIGLEYKGRELIYSPQDAASFNGSSPGSPVLYPTPNRIAGGKFSWEGREFFFGLNDGDRFLHGLVRDKAWEYEILPAADNGVAVRMWIDFSPGGEIFETFGIDHRLTLTYSLDKDGLKIEHKVENRDSISLPYGIAYHPYLNYLGSKEANILCVPAKKHHEAVNLMPTGKLEDLDGQPFDIRKPTPVPDLILDDVYWGMTPENQAWVEFRDAGIRLEFRTSLEFTHMVVYIQPQNEFFCVENQTCSTDAINLWNAGLKEESQVLVVEPGGSSSGWVHYVLSDI